jgi:hypothetical protein
MTLLAEKHLLSVTCKSANAPSSVFGRRAQGLTKRQLTSGVTGLVAWYHRRLDIYCPGRRFVVFVAKGTASNMFVHGSTTTGAATREQRCACFRRYHGTKFRVIEQDGQGIVSTEWSKSCDSWRLTLS